MKIKSPKDYCDSYFKGTYDGELPKQQVIEIGCAFHAGIEAVCKFMDEFMDDPNVDDDQLVQRMIRFRKINKDCAMHYNMLRFAE